MPETKRTEVNKDSIRPGDTVEITRTATVRSVDRFDNSFMTTDNRKVKLSGSRDYNGKILPGFTVTRIDPVVTTPQHWPPQESDVWADGSGNEYHVFVSYGSHVVRDKDQYSVPLDTLKAKKGITLVHRKGNK